MTRREKFIEVFGQEPDTRKCPIDDCCHDCKYMIERPIIKAPYYDEIRSPKCIRNFWFSEYSQKSEA